MNLAFSGNHDIDRSKVHFETKVRGHVSHAENTIWKRSEPIRRSKKASSFASISIPSHYSINLGKNSNEERAIGYQKNTEKTGKKNPEIETLQ